MRFGSGAGDTADGCGGERRTFLAHGSAPELVVPKWRDEFSYRKLVSKEDKVCPCTCWLNAIPLSYSVLSSNLTTAMETLEGLSVSSPLYLVSATQPCNLCNKESAVVALATKHLVDEFEPEADDGFLLCYVEELPDDILVEIIKRHPNFEMRSSMTAGNSYYMTICECGGHYGDHYVQKELFNQICYAQEEVTVEKLPVTGTWVIPCAYSQSMAVSELLNRAKK